MDCEKGKKAFDEYVASYDKGEKEILSKYHHSYAVSDLMAELAFRLNLSKEEIVLAKVIGILHDIGRFEQLRKSNAFNDCVLDHAKISCDYLFKEEHIRDFIEDDSYDNIIENAIRYHNKYELPKLKGKELLFSKMIRDMDKVDIYKQLALCPSLVFDVDSISEGALEQFEKRMSVDKTYQQASDQIVSALAFVFDINFEESYDILVETDNFDLFLSTVEVMPNSEKLWKKLREVCFDKINQGVGEEK